jgi:hypothetical protein
MGTRLAPSSDAGRDVSGDEVSPTALTVFGSAPRQPPAEGDQGLGVPPATDAIIVWGCSSWLGE